MTKLKLFQVLPPSVPNPLPESYKAKVREDTFTFTNVAIKDIKAAETPACNGSRKIGPQAFFAGKFGPDKWGLGKLGLGRLGPGIFLTANWAPEFFGPNWALANCKKLGKLGKLLVQKCQKSYSQLFNAQI